MSIFYVCQALTNFILDAFKELLVEMGRFVEEIDQDVQDQTVLSQYVTHRQNTPTQ